MPGRSYAHPMLEPINYNLDPTQASQYFSGDELKIYNLLWHAAVATHVEGPVVREHSLFAPLPINATLCANWTELLEPGWTLFLPQEPIDATNVSYRSSTNTNQALTPFTPSYTPDLLLHRQLKKDLLLSINQATSKGVSVKEILPIKLTYSNLLQQMANFKVARPSTYASRLEATIKNGLLGEDNGTIYLTANGCNILEKIAQLPTDEQLNKNTSYAIEKAIDEIEKNPKKSGAYLNDFCEKILNKPSSLSTWIDALVIEGETLQEISDRAYTVCPEKPYQTEIKEKLTSEQEITDQNLIDILIKENAANAIKYIEHAWDDYSFESKSMHIQYIGRLHTRKARRLTVEKEKIFSEHIRDYQQITNCCFVQTIPYYSFVELIHFSVLTDRRQGMLYLENLSVHYSHSDPSLAEIEIDIQEVKMEINNNLSEYVLPNGCYLYGPSQEDDIEIVLC